MAGVAWPKVRRLQFALQRLHLPIAERACTYLQTRQICLASSLGDTNADHPRYTALVQSSRGGDCGAERGAGSAGGCRAGSGTGRAGQEGPVGRCEGGQGGSGCDGGWTGLAPLTLVLLALPPVGTASSEPEAVTAR